MLNIKLLSSFLQDYSHVIYEQEAHDVQVNMTTKTTANNQLQVAIATDTLQHIYANMQIKMMISGDFTNFLTLFNTTIEA